MDKPTRKQNRLPGYDYRTYHCYFVTVCTQNKQPYFWSAPEQLSKLGEIVNSAILDLPKHYPSTVIEKYVVMPNHIHIMLLLENENKETAPSLSRIVKQLKGYVSKQAGFPVWQKSFYDRVVRSQQEYEEVWKYIDNNPAALAIRKENNE